MTSRAGGPPPPQGPPAPQQGPPAPQSQLERQPESEPPAARPPGLRRILAGGRLSDVLLLAAGVLVFVLATLTARTDGVPGLEQDVFRAVNDTVTLPFFLVWVVMQLGNVVVVPVAAAVVAVRRRFRLALGILVGGLAGYLLAKEVKDVVARKRPGGLLDDVELRGGPAGGLGYVSGHAVVTVFVATVLAPYLGRRGRWVVYTLATLVCFARVYTGAHLPLDVIGGAALGLALGAGFRWFMPRPAE